MVQTMGYCKPVKASPMDVDISVLFVTYNRSDLLEITFRSLRERADFGSRRVEFIVSDDASDERHLARLMALPFDKHVLSLTNKGLGNNCNKGIAESVGLYILQVQDDCEFVGARTLVSTAVQLLEEDSEVGLVQLTHQTPNIAHEKRQLSNGTLYCVFENDNIQRRRKSGTRPYSDQPHLKRRSFCDEIGSYKEGASMVEMELEYQERVACQNRWRIASIGLPSGFRHLGAERTFNPVQLRSQRIERLESYTLIGPILRQGRAVARYVRKMVYAGRCS